MAVLDSVPVGLQLSVPCKNIADVAFKNLQVFPEGLGGVDPYLGNAGSSSAAQWVHKRKLVLDGAGRIYHVPDVVVPDQAITHWGCPRFYFCTCPLPHNTGATGNFRQMFPDGSWYRATLDIYFLNDSSGRFEFQRTCEWTFQLEFSESPNVLGCVPVGRVEFDPSSL